MNKKVLSIISFIVISIILITSIVILYKPLSKAKANDKGYITIVVNDMDGNIKSIKNINYNKGDTLFDLINNNYNIKYEEGGYGCYLIGISDDDFSLDTNGKTSWLWLELGYKQNGNEEFDINNYKKQTVNEGISYLKIKDKMLLSITMQDNTHNYLIFDSFEKTNKNYTLIIALVILIIALLTMLPAIIIFSLKEEKLVVRDIALIAILAGIMFVLEEIMTFLPNIQLTVLLIVLFSKKLGLKRTSLIVLIHVILDNLFMGSFNFIYTPFMLAGWLIIPLSLNTIFKKVDNKLILALLGILFAFIYCWLYIIPSSLYFNINIKAYFISDILFELLLAASSFISIYLLYNPLSKVIENMNK